MVAAGSIAVNAGPPLSLDETRTLEALSARSPAYHVGYNGYRWHASRKDGTGDTLRGLTPDDLAAAIRDDRSRAAR
ncbi:MAG TPA: hypothetical protein VN714_14205 [Trebonia sp.]|nr:hypothetical protein [Trebonia sp.]